MSVVTAVILAAVALAMVLGLIARTRRTAADPIDPRGVEHWLLRHRNPDGRLTKLLLAADRRVVGGVGVALTLATLFVGALAVGWIFDTVDTDRGFARWDQAVAEWGSANATETSTDVLGFITHGGDTVYLVILMVAVALADWARWRNPSVFLFVASVGIGVSLLNNGLKWLVLRERPIVDHLVGSSGSSFPSGHSAAAAACWAAVALLASRHVGPRLRPYLAAAAGAVAGLVAASRALLGVHWLTDVIAGVIVGWAWFFIVALIFGGRLQRLGEPVEVVQAEEEAAVLTGRRATLAT